eukprot:2382046-Amphidinium_carterae.1
MPGKLRHLRQGGSDPLLRDEGRQVLVSMACGAQKNTPYLIMSPTPQKPPIPKTIHATQK